jgi:hypothetical protein
MKNNPLYAITHKNDRSVLLATANDITEARTLRDKMDGDIRLYCEAKLYFKT